MRRFPFLCSGDGATQSREEGCAPMKTNQSRMQLWLAIVGSAALYIAVPASATTIILSNQSSDPGVPASLLDATLDFAVSGSTLTLTVSNDTSDLDILAIYFNAPSAVTGLDLSSSPNKWKVVSSVDVDPFGTFDWGVEVKLKDSKKDKFDAGDTGVFEFALEGTGSFTAADFGGEAAAHFANGSTDAVGATHMPEPQTALLVASGLVSLALGRRRRRG